MFLFYYYVPESHIDIVNKALFDLGLGKYQNYDCCCFISQGQGQFRPLSGSKPFIGEINAIEHVNEYKVEMICPNYLKEKAIETLSEAHPYETPAYGLLHMVE